MSGRKGDGLGLIGKGCGRRGMVGLRWYGLGGEGWGSVGVGVGWVQVRCSRAGVW